jgi:serine/threonine protein kinase
VHLIDSSWQRLSDYTFEILILMELCPGGGIIDMMNRRLRERLSEAEILQVFVDVCEAVAFMHSRKPPILHRDLKVGSDGVIFLCDLRACRWRISSSRLQVHISYATLAPLLAEPQHPTLSSSSGP